MTSFLSIPFIPYILFVTNIRGTKHESNGIRQLSLLIGKERKKRKGRMERKESEEVFTSAWSTNRKDNPKCPTLLTPPAAIPAAVLVFRHPVTASPTRSNATTTRGLGRIYTTTAGGSTRSGGYNGFRSVPSANVTAELPLPKSRTMCGHTEGTCSCFGIRRITNRNARRVTTRRAGAKSCTVGRDTGGGTGKGSRGGLTSALFAHVYASAVGLPGTQGI
jgi:hypothetical protein